MANRRAPGEGSVWHDEKLDRWIAQLTLPSGKKKTKYGKTQTEVKKWLLEQRKAVQDNTYIEAKDITLSAFLDRFMSDVAAHKLRAKTIDSYNYLIRSHLKPELGEIKLTQLRADQIQNLYSNKLNSGLSRRTVQYMHAVLHKSLEQAVRWGLVIRNVSDMVEPPTPKKKTPDSLTADQVKDLFEAVKDDRLHALYVLAAMVGLREGELLGLTYKNVDLNEGVIHIVQAVQYLPGKGLVVSEPKTESSKRAIKLPQIALEALKEHQKRFPSKTYVFATSNETPISPRNLLRHWHATLEKIGIEQKPFHTLRHTCASLLIGQVHPKIVQALLGHSTISMTLNTYSHLLPGIQDEAAEKMDKLFA